MATHRVASNELYTDTPLEMARETAWQALTISGVAGVVIDLPKNLVAGIVPGGVFSGTRVVRVTFTRDLSGVRITVLSLWPTAVNRTTVSKTDFGQSIRYSGALTDILQDLLSKGWTRADVPAVETLAAIPPIALPTGEIFEPQPGLPVYGHFGPVPMGSAIAGYSVLSLICCHIASPFALWLAIRTLKDYGADDPGDKLLVWLALILSFLSSGVLVCTMGATLWEIVRP